MKKFLTALLAFSLCFMTACGGSGKSGENDVSDNSVSVGQDSETSENVKPEHVHNLIKQEAKASTCTKKGNIEFYYCPRCKGYYLDENAEQESSFEGTRAPLAPHDAAKTDGYAPTCGEVGLKEHWTCLHCSEKFIDEECSQHVWDTDLEIPALAHKNITYHEGFPVEGDKDGQLSHWYCQDCEGYYLDESFTERVEWEDVILYSAVNIPDFIVEIPDGRDPVVLQLTDTQIIDGAQARPDKSSGDKITYATPLIKNYCYDYLTEIIQATKPDFIIITGDLVYGEYDDNGSVLKAFVEFMDSFKINWAPVFGNHENESAMGVDWQCEQLENSEYCLFEQKELTGNGNYSVGIMQGGKLTRVFYMLDSNGCGNPSEATLENMHFRSSVGFGSDQIEWYTNQITELKALSPDTKISFAYHIQTSVFGEALEQYGFVQSQKYQDFFIDYLANKQAGDFGFVGRQMKDGWDSSKTVFNGMKALGADSIFVGHEHCNSASVMFEGVRLQYGQKSSEYDRYNCVLESGEIAGFEIWNKRGTALVGGSVIVLSETDGGIKDAYIYYCSNAGQNVDWDAVAKKYTK